MILLQENECISILKIFFLLAELRFKVRLSRGRLLSLVILDTVGQRLEGGFTGPYGTPRRRAILISGQRPQHMFHAHVHTWNVEVGKYFFDIKAKYGVRGIRKLGTRGLNKINCLPQFQVPRRSAGGKPFWELRCNGPHAESIVGAAPTSPLSYRKT